MRVLGISGPAERDLEGISDYTQTMWGERQVLRYMATMQERLELLARSPHMGRPCNSLAPGLGLRRFEVEKHVVFYMEQTPGILVVRVLHESVLPVPKYFSDRSATS